MIDKYFSPLDKERCSLLKVSNHNGAKYSSSPANIPVPTTPASQPTPALTNISSAPAIQVFQPTPASVNVSAPTIQVSQPTPASVNTPASTTLNYFMVVSDDSSDFTRADDNYSGFSNSDMDISSDSSKISDSGQS